MPPQDGSPADLYYRTNMRGIFTSVALVFLAMTSVPAGQPQTSAAAPASPMLTVDSIMRGPRLVGTAPANIRWSRDSSKIYFTWQKPEDKTSSTWIVSRD